MTVLGILQHIKNVWRHGSGVPPGPAVRNITVVSRCLQKMSSNITDASMSMVWGNWHPSAFYLRLQQRKNFTSQNAIGNPRVCYHSAECTAVECEALIFKLLQASQHQGRI